MSSSKIERIKKILVKKPQFPVLLGFVGFAAFFLFYHPFSMAQGAQMVEIVIRNSTYIPQENIIKKDEPVTIVLRNQDKIRHGFSSQLLEELNV